MGGSETSRIVAALMVVGGACAYATMPTLAKLAYAGGVNSLGLQTVRFPLGALLLAGMVAARGRGAFAVLKDRRLLPIVVLFFLKTLAFFEGLDRMDASLMVILLFLYPMLVAVGAAVTGREPFTRRMALVLPLVLSGVVLSVGYGRPTALGVTLGLASAVLYAWFFLLAKELLRRRLDALELTTALYLGASLGFVGGSLVRPMHLPSDAAGWLTVLAFCAAGVLASAILQLPGLRRLPAGATSLLATTEPVAAVVLATALLGEPMRATQGLGAALVIGGLVVLVWPRGNRTVWAPESK